MASLDSSKRLDQNHRHRETVPYSPPYPLRGLSTRPCRGMMYDSDLLVSQQETRTNDSPHSSGIGNPAGGSLSNHPHSRLFPIGHTTVFHVSDLLDRVNKASGPEGVTELKGMNLHLYGGGGPEGMVYSEWPRTSGGNDTVLENASLAVDGQMDSVAQAVAGQGDTAAQAAVAVAGQVDIVSQVVVAVAGQEATVVQAVVAVAD